MDLDLLLSTLESAYLVRPAADPEPAFLFNHVLVQETAYSSLLVKGRRELHLQVAAAIEHEYASQLDVYVPTLAYHFWAGEDFVKAAQYSRRAGERALQVYAHREAMGYYKQALAALDRIPGAAGEEVCDVILGWADASFGLEPYSKQLELLARAERTAREMGDKRRLALILHTTGRVHVAAGHPLRSGPSLKECYDLAAELGDEKLLVFPTFSMGAATYDSDPRRALQWLDRAIGLARKYDNVDVEAYAVSLKGMVEARLGETTDSLRDLAQASQLVPSIKSPICDSDVHLYSAWAYLDLGNTQRGLEFAKQGVDKAVSADNLECACFAYACLGFGHLRVEQIEDATQAFDEAIRRSKFSGAEPAQILGEMGLGMTRFISGHPEGIQQIQDALEHARKVGEAFTAALISQTLGEISFQRGGIESAVGYLNSALDYYRRHQMRPYLSRALDLLADALERQGDHAGAEQVRSEKAGQLPNPVSSATPGERSAAAP